MNLRKSSMDYSLKANRYLRGVALTPCPNCPFKKEHPPVPLSGKTKKCFQRCKFRIIIWILNDEQSKIYEKVRPPKLKKEDIELAIKAGKIAQIEEIKGAPELTVAPSLFLVEINN